MAELAVLKVGRPWRDDDWLRCDGAGAGCTVRVTQPRRIGKYTRLRIRRGKAPLRIDRCLMPGRSRPAKCPNA